VKDVVPDNCKNIKLTLADPTVIITAENSNPKNQIHFNTTIIKNTQNKPLSNFAV